MVIATKARENTYFNKEQPKEHSDYLNYKIEYGDIEQYRINRRIARGKYSEVFEGRTIVGNKKEKQYENCIIKVLKPIRKVKINREVKILRMLNHINIIKLLDVVMDDDSQTHSLLFEYLNYQELSGLMTIVPLNDARIYAKQILSALKYVHSKGIIHRDIKPSNILVNPTTKHLKIIDWGMAEFYFPLESYPLKTCTRHYKPPEILLGYGYYDHSMDIWSFGVLFAEMVFGYRPFFCGSCDSDQLYKIVEALGENDLLKHLKKYEIVLDAELMAGIPTSSKIEWSDCFVDGESNNEREVAIKLIDKILVYDHINRLTASECLENVFFNVCGIENN